MTTWKKDEIKHIYKANLTQRTTKNVKTDKFKTIIVTIRQIFSFLIAE